MKISEIFLSISGESTGAGLLTTFIRMFGCNLKCSYCDSTYSIEGNDYEDLTIHEIMDRVHELDCGRIILTGGEPLLIQSNAEDLIRRLVMEGYQVEIETNGACDLKPFRKYGVQFTMDWKCPSSGLNDKMIFDNLLVLNHHDVLKFVVGTQEDLEEVLRIVPKTQAQCFISPVFGKIEPAEIVEFMKAHIDVLKYTRFQLQIHKFVWPVDARGV